MAKKQPKTEANFTVSISHDDMAKFGNPQTVKFTEDTDKMQYGDCTFKITMGNEVQLRALSKYAQMLDFVTHATPDEQLNVDGLVNCILNEGMAKRIKELAKRHGFEDSAEFIDCMNACGDGDEVSVEIKEHERAAYQRAHDAILAHIPIEDRQMNLFDNAK